MPDSPRIPSYRLHKSTGQAIVTLSGRDIYLGRHATPESHSAYERAVAEWLAAGRKLAVERCPDPSVSEVLGAYLGYAKGYYSSAGTSTSQLDRVKRSLAPAVEMYGTVECSRFGPAALKAVRQKMIAAGLRRRVINQRVGCLVRAFKWAAGDELIPASVWHALRAVEGLRAQRSEAPESEPVRPVPEPDIEAAKPHLLPVLRDVIDLQLLTAMRPGEALAMRPADIDRSGKVWVYRPADHKTKYRGQARDVLIGPRCQELLAHHLAETGPEHYLFSARKAVAARFLELGQPTRWGKTRTPGDRYQVGSYGHAVTKACRRAGIPLWHPHQLRHNAATRLVEQFGWDVARIILGHRHLSTTKIYAEDDIRKAAEAVAKIG